MSRQLDDYLDGCHELQADIEERDADLRDSTFLARRRRVGAADTRTPEERERDRARGAAEDTWRARQGFIALTPRLRCDDCGLSTCDGGPDCRGDRT